MCEVLSLQQNISRRLHHNKRDSEVLKLTHRTLEGVTLEQTFPMILVGSVLMVGDSRPQALAILSEKYR